jgi:hypothetical protein
VFEDLVRHRVREFDVASDIESKPSVSPLRCDRTARIHNDQLRAIAHTLENVMEEDRVRFARVRSPQDDQVGLFGLLIRARAAARSENRRQTGDAGSVSGTVTAIDVVAADNGAREFLRQEIQLVRRFRAAEQTKSVGSALLDGECYSSRGAV